MTQSRPRESATVPEWENSAFAKSLLLDDNSSAANLAADEEITDLDLHEIAAARFAVDGKAE